MTEAKAVYPPKLLWIYRTAQNTVPDLFWAFVSTLNSQSVADQYWKAIVRLELQGSVFHEARRFAPPLHSTTDPPTS